ncbi:MAG: ornithine cyclodeaminase [Methylobacter sp.]|uniref:ornithine cyclodeaminase n=1 Tax=Methylobacter sp. TaxID=2051955 RepID=UPI002731BCE8|nr:ornithine cyclodeaminase [Methylobacter sp.]MDP1663795.1 ornithine cyclodeaminase [Methylobacter sp.]
MKILTVTDVLKLIQIINLENFFKRVITALEEDFGRWNEFMLSPRHGTYYRGGVIELMPCADRQFYTFKYVNGYPGNPLKGKLNVVAIGVLSDADSGYPLMISEMTLLTAFRTAAAGVLAAKYLAREDAKTLAIIGAGAQAEFQVLAFAGFFKLEKVRFFDTDPQAMIKFSKNLAGQKFNLIACSNIVEAVRNADIVITATAAKKRQSLFEFEDIAPGAYIYAMGGDSPGKTELSAAFLKQVKLVVEYKPQSLVEGEVQQCGADLIYAELWELVCKHKPGRQNNQEITLFDSVGFALEDYSILRVVYELAKEYHLGTESVLIPELNDPKNLFGLLSS